MNLKTLPPSSSICRCQQKNQTPKLYLVIYCNNERGRNQRYTYVFESCKVPQESKRACRRHCRRGAALCQQQNNTVWNSRYTPAGKVQPAPPSFCYLVYRGSNYTLLETYIIPRAWRHIQKCPWVCAFHSEGLVQLPSTYPYTENEVVYNRRSARVLSDLLFSSPQETATSNCNFFLN